MMTEDQITECKQHLDEFYDDAYHHGVGDGILIAFAIGLSLAGLVGIYHLFY